VFTGARLAARSILLASPVAIPISIPALPDTVAGRAVLRCFWVIEHFSPVNFRAARIF
jgi:hypothetical protein